ncbi:MAG TPA: hypothetical protein VFY66_10370, partial [Anaerolineales bacterium]|nr:hypothetical protein [Anaerolineales bacterium]
MMHKSVVQMKLADCRSKALLITLSVLVPCNPNRSIDAPPPIVQRTELITTTMPLDRTGSLSPSSDLIALGVDLDVQAARQNPSQAYLVNLTNYPANDLTPTRSSDGRQLAFISTRYGVYIMNADGSHTTLLIQVPEGWLTPVWRPSAECG